MEGRSYQNGKLSDARLTGFISRKKRSLMLVPRSHTRSRSVLHTINLPSCTGLWCSSYRESISLYLTFTTKLVCLYHSSKDCTVRGIFIYQLHHCMCLECRWEQWAEAKHVRAQAFRTQGANLPCVPISEAFIKNWYCTRFVCYPDDGGGGGGKLLRAWPGKATVRLPSACLNFNRTQPSLFSTFHPGKVEMYGQFPRKPDGKARTKQQPSKKKKKKRSQQRKLRKQLQINFGERDFPWNQSDKVDSAAMGSAMQSFFTTLAQLLRSGEDKNASIMIQLFFVESILETSLTQSTRFRCAVLVLTVCVSIVM